MTPPLETDEQAGRQAGYWPDSRQAGRALAGSKRAGRSPDSKQADARQNPIGPGKLSNQRNENHNMGIWQALVAVRIADMFSYRIIIVTCYQVQYDILLSWPK